MFAGYPAKSVSGATLASPHLFAEGVKVLVLELLLLPGVVHLDHGVQVWVQTSQLLHIDRVSNISIKCIYLYL